MPLLDHVPTLTSTQALATLAELLDLAPDRLALVGLPSERDANWRVDRDGEPWAVLKVSNTTETSEFLAAQHKAMRAVADAGVPASAPISLGGSDIVTIDGYLARLLTWQPGVPMAQVHPAHDELLIDLGRTMGRVSLAMAPLTLPAAEREFHWDVARAGQVVDQLREAVTNEADRALLDRALERWNRIVAPVLGDLPRQLVHGDANDHNVVVDPGDPTDPSARFRAVTGLLDFGDMVMSARVSEVAVAAAYAVLSSGAARTPIDAIRLVVSGFHEVCPLTPAEVAVVWEFVRARLAMSVCHSAVQQAQRPGDAYLSVSEAAAWTALRAMDTVPDRLAEYVLRGSCGWEVHPRRAAVLVWLAANPPAPLLGTPWADLRLFSVDISVGSSTMGAGDNDSGPDRLERAVRVNVDGDPDAIGLGGYGEARLIYAGEAFADSASRRSIHLACDIWTTAEQPLHAPYAGTVILANDNDGDYDYGPVVMLEHRTDAGDAFFSLYGHLNRATLQQVRHGQSVGAGEVFGWVGTPPTNGNWPPHVHVQLLLDSLDLGPDTPGVATPDDAEIWLSLCPDPAALLGVSSELTAAPVPRPVEQTHAERRSRLGRNLSVSYSAPLRIVRGMGARLYDDRGRAYLDCVNNVAHVGHANPRVVAAELAAARVLNTNTRYLHEAVLTYARRLTATLPEPLSVCYFVNSGSEANDLALRLIRTATGKRGVVALEDGYHGHTEALIDVSSYKHAAPGGTGTPDHVRIAARPDPYRGEVAGYGRDAAIAAAGEVRRCAEELAQSRHGLAGFIAESLIGCGGQIVLPEDYLVDAAAAVRSAGGLVIADEVQVGFGRVGPEFWGFATHAVIPDVVTMGKPAGNGHPLAVVVTTPEIADAFDNGMEYFNTFGGNPVSSAIGLAVLDEIEERGLAQRAAHLGVLITGGASELAQRYSLIGDVRGVGMYAGIELVRDRESREPAAAEAKYVIEQMRNRGVLVSIDGPLHNVLKIKPPLVWTDADAGQFLSTLDEVLADPALRRD